MKKLLLLFAFLLFAGAASATTVTGTVILPDGSAPVPKRAIVRFQLMNFGSNQPKVIATGAFAARVQDIVVTDVNGTFSGTVLGNDVITPINTFYNVCVIYQGQQFSCGNYLITGSAWSLNTASTITGTPLPAPTIFGAKSALCTFTSSLTSWTCNHNLQSQEAFSMAFTLGYQFLIPDTVTNTSANTTTATFTSGQTGRLLVFVRGQDADSSVFKTVRVNVVACATSGCSVAFTWSQAFADTSYQAVCSVLETGAQSEAGGLRVAKIRALSASGITVDFDNLSGTTLDGTLMCMALRP